MVMAEFRLAELTDAVMCTPLMKEYEQIRLLGLDSPRCNEAII